ncbi:S1C family serine protease [Acidisoma silvae]|uniref:Serine protease n=1 Tax=Acidisoma silvae TaxID=2802396 RepID=A0A963YUR1_9PROT|nr:S1C family serine protease [Acidisoma silvae]MCB8876668.1 serine protease [Acidisoma silvae]
MPKGSSIPTELQPDPAHYAFDLETALAAIVSLRVTAPADAFTASALGTEREGSGVVIRDDGLILTIGYLVAEAETIWITAGDGQLLPGHALAYDAETGFGLVQPLGRLKVQAMELGQSAQVELGQPAIFASAGGRRMAIETRIVGRQEFAGYWEYLLDDAFFTAPAHPFWGGAALISREAKLLGIGSLSLQQDDARGNRLDMNMVVPIDLLHSVFGDLTRYGRVNRPGTPWLGIYAMEEEERVLIGGVAEGGPADLAGLRQGDQVLALDGEEILSLAHLWRSVRGRGTAGARVTLSVQRDERELRVPIATVDRHQLLKGPRLH